MFTILKNWQELESYSNEYHGIRFIYKHSATCPTSILAKQQIEKAMEEYPDVSVVYIHVRDQRTLSNQVEEYFKVKHESPQLLTIKNGKVQDVKNHHSVTAAYMQHILGGGYNSRS